VVDEDIYQRINTLVDEEKVLREHETPEDVTRLALIEETLDQCWICCANVVRCVNSARSRKAEVRDVDTVERYEQ